MVQQPSLSFSRTTATLHDNIGMGSKVQASGHVHLIRGIDRARSSKVPPVSLCVDKHRSVHRVGTRCNTIWIGGCATSDERQRNKPLLEHAHLGPTDGIPQRQRTIRTRRQNVFGRIMDGDSTHHTQNQAKPRTCVLNAFTSSNPEAQILFIVTNIVIWTRFEREERIDSKYLT